MKKIFLAVAGVAMICVAHAQNTKLWTEADRKYLQENLIRSRDELIKETTGLSKKQWSFKESPDRWSINEVVEHLALYELIFDVQIVQCLSTKPQPELNKTAKPDSTYLNFIMEAKPHVSSDFSKPFTYTIPMGLNELQNNMSWFLKMRNESVDFVRTTDKDLRAYYRWAEAPNIHQTYIYAFGHIDRQLRQIRKIKQHPNYPK